MLRSEWSPGSCSRDRASGCIPRFARSEWIRHKRRMAELSETELLDLERRDKQATLAPWTYSADPRDVNEPVKASNRKGIWSALGELRRAGDGAFIATVRN